VKAKIFLSSVLLITLLACTPSSKVNTCPTIPIPDVETLPVVNTPVSQDGKYCFTPEDAIRLKQGIDILKNRVNKLEQEITIYNKWQKEQEK
jgi:hypothetical protein